MPKQLLLAIFLLFFCINKLQAQTDTSNYDLGRISVKKNFTQHITITAADLQRYPFSDLADAINVWFYGTYTNAANLVYVVDGNILTDVNAYSINDVEEITLIQNSLGQISGASPAQQMVLIKLKTNWKGKQGIEATGQSNFITLHNDQNTSGEKSNSGMYNQYYISGYKNLKDASFGISAEIQHDVLPQFTSSNFISYSPFNFNRFRLNTWGNINLWKGTKISYTIGYSPQVSNYSSDISGINLYYNSEYEGRSDNLHASQHLFNTTISLKTDITPGLHNEMALGYNHYNYFENFNSNGYISIDGNITSGTYGHLSSFTKTGDLLLRDNLIYTKKASDFLIEPAVNFSFRNANYLDNSISSLYSYAGNNLSNNYPASVSQAVNAGKDKTYLLSPSINLIYKDFINLQTGFTGILNPDHDFIPGYDKPRFSPFVTAALDFSKIAGLTNFNLKLFGSFSRQNEILNDPAVALEGFYSTNFPNASPIFINGNSVPPAIYASNAAINPYQQYNNYQFGAVWNLAKKLSFSYSNETHNYKTLGVIEIPIGGNGVQTEYYFFSDRTITNCLAINYNLNSGALSWRTGLNVSQVKLELVDQTAIANNYYNTYINNGHRYSGGFTNRFSYKSFFAGADLLYQIGERMVSIENLTYGSTLSGYNPNKQSFSLQNLYVGTQLKIAGIKYAEAYLNARNLWQNNSADITDNREFIGFGFKLGL